jgi:HK97 family phage portal protein
MATPSLNAKNKPSWPIRTFRKLISRIDPEIFHQERDFTFDQYGIRKAVGGKFGEFGSESSQFVIDRPSAGSHIDAAKAMENNTGFVYAATKAIAREVMNIEFRLFQVKGQNHDELEEHELLELLDGVNDFMTGPELKYLLSHHLDLAGNGYWYLEGVKNELDKPKAIYCMDPSRVRIILDKTTWPYKVVGYRMKLENREMTFEPYEILHFRDPNPLNPYEGVGPVQSIAPWIDLDNYAMEFNRKFFINGARPSGFLESEAVAETQIEALKIGFADMHGGIDNMNRIAVLPKGVKWTPAGTNPKDMDFKNLSADTRDRILAAFGVSKTILGTAESDTNRATAETADYVFSKRVIKPRMQLICSFLNERLVPRYGDDLYISFLDPVPEDRAARTTEMQVSVGSQPVITVNEAREQFMGLGPVDGGDELMRPTAMTPADEPELDPNAGKPPKTPKDAEQEEQDQENSKGFPRQKFAFRPLRTKLQQRAKQRKEMAQSLADKISGKLKAALATKKFSTKEQDEIAWKEFSARTHKAETEIKETIRVINAKQKAEVLDNLPSAIEKGIDPTKLFDIDNWISITTDAMTPIMETLFETEGKAAAAAIGKPDMNPLTDIARAALHESIGKMSESYQSTTLATLEAKINDGLSQGQGLSDISKTVSEIYEWSDDYRADRVAKTEAFRTANTSLKETWKQSGVVKTIKWYTSSTEPCPFCEQMNGKVISVDDNFFNNSESLTVGEGDNAQTMSLDYGDVGSPPLHPNCMCVARPEDVSLD